MAIMATVAMAVIVAAAVVVGSPLSLSFKGEDQTPLSPSPPHLVGMVASAPRHLSQCAVPIHLTANVGSPPPSLWASALFCVFFPAPLQKMKSQDRFFVSESFTFPSIFSHGTECKKFYFLPAIIKLTTLRSPNC